MYVWVHYGLVSMAAGPGSMLSLCRVPLTYEYERGDDVQIVRSWDEPQMVVARSPLHILQYPVLGLSRMQRIYQPEYLNLRSSMYTRLIVDE